MNVLVAGANGNTGRQVVKLLAERGYTVRAMVRDMAQGPALVDLGGEPVLGDLETDDVASAPAGCDAVIFAAGAGAGSGPARKETVDYGGAVKLMDAAVVHGVRRFVMLSAQIAGDPESVRHESESLYAYALAKAKADQRLESSDLDFTIVRPGRLTNEPGTGTITAATILGRRGEIGRADVAATLVSCLEVDRTIGLTFEILSGDTPIREALQSL
ncbi:MAG: SDR family oxidoreductase [Gammaproteobacteria bacterium]|nr:SDR family oxidoreductase [Gammaproteobacteria bacterium]NIR83812.1 SDR family oxidoreductase [Gammaproteobacteria bacterium]NIR88229.1 SDR family oxidoreductase [Gammaproteobacteria bacterium]NIU05138.1 SDR family oxidoreductase [Gammaproteobacteria bacterium]NIV51975.1 NAD(P)H-binding protein [Gammaproteobacteria bacterium]